MKIVRSLTTLLGVLIVVYGCSESAGRKDTVDGMLTAAEYREALEQEADAFTWPETYTPNIDAIAKRTSSPDALIADDGAVPNMLELFNMCIWYVTWNDARSSGDSTTQQQALSIMRSTIPDYEEEEHQRAYFEGIATDAELGDPSGVQAVITNTCAPLDWIDGRV